MTKTFFISDTHFGHTNAALKFTKDDGTPMRVNPITKERFTSTEDMDNYMITQWNTTVGEKDRVYHIGDFCINRKSLQILNQLNGRICMILGNHDLWKKKDWEQFKNVDHLLGAKMFPKLGWIATHIPVHERQFYGRWTHNIHGHAHTRNVLKSQRTGFLSDSYIEEVEDKRYFNVSVEQIDYTPISLEEIKGRLQ